MYRPSRVATDACHRVPRVSRSRIAPMVPLVRAEPLGVCVYLRPAVVMILEIARRALLVKAVFVSTAGFRVIDSVPAQSVLYAGKVSGPGANVSMPIDAAPVR